MPQRNDVFISYSHKDEKWLDRLCVHLRPLEKKYPIIIWSDTRILPGDRWKSEVAAALNSAKVAILLVSADFLSSEFITTAELPPLLRAAEKEGATVLPLLLSACGFLATEGLRDLQFVNREAQPLIKLPKHKREDILARLARQVQMLLAPAEPEAAPAALPQDAEALWPLIRKELQRELNPEDFLTWFHPLKIRCEGSQRLVLLAPDVHFLRRLAESFRPQVDRAVAALGGVSLEILFALDDEGSLPRSTQVAVEQQAQFNPRYRFETFVVGHSNEFAYAAAQAVTEAPSPSYNPLFLYGGVGVGKTHLLHAIGSRIAERQPHLRVAYMHTEQFTNELIKSIRFNRMSAFHERMRTVDVLLLDDVQFLAPKERTEEEFFHIFNTLFDSHKQIVLTADASPRSIPFLEERLRIRFAWGLLADIQPPELETKMTIVHRKAELEGIRLPEDLVDFIANLARSSVRELEGLLNRVIAVAALTGRPVSKDLGLETLKDILPNRERLTDGTEEILKYVARYYRVKVSEIKGRNNVRQMAIPRQTAMYLCKKLTTLSYTEIGTLFGDRHYSSVMYAVDKVENLRATDPDLYHVLKSIEQCFC